MGKSNVGILTHEIIMVTHPERAGRKSETTDRDTNKGVIYLRLDCLHYLLLKDTDSLHHEFHQFQTC